MSNKDVFEEADEKNNIVGGVAVDRLKSIIERVERLEQEKKELSNDIRDIYAESKSAGFDSVDYVIMEVPSYQEVTKLKEDINTLKNIILKLSPSHREYLEKNFKD